LDWILGHQRDGQCVAIAILEKAQSGAGIRMELGVVPADVEVWLPVEPVRFGRDDDRARACRSVSSPIGDVAMQQASSDFPVARRGSAVS
jgi:hypothetical protein